MVRKLALASSFFVALLHAGCAAETVHDDDEPEPTESTSSALTATDPVSEAVTQACSTTAVKGLATQLVKEIQCLRPGTMARIDNVAGLKLGAAVFPFLQAPAADALMNAQKARGVTMEINSGLRTLPQQYLLYRWYQTGRCGIGLAARPGTSNHESALAVDINDNAGWRSALQSKGWVWLGASDPVHYDFKGEGATELGGLSVKAFQRLWNRNHPEDLIVEDGDYGAATEARLARAPSGGFAVDAKCDAPGQPSEPPAPAPAPQPEKREPESDGSESGNSRSRGAANVQSGCAIGAIDARGGEPWLAIGGVGLGFALSRRRRRFSE